MPTKSTSQQQKIRLLSKQKTAGDTKYSKIKIVTEKNVFCFGHKSISFVIKLWIKIVSNGVSLL